MSHDSHPSSGHRSHPSRSHRTGRIAGLARLALAAGLSLALGSISGLAYGRGDVTPQAVDTHALPTLGAAWRAENPFRKNDTAVKIGRSA